MDQHETGRKRKRPVTSCWECYRRKQKCDRVKPCCICVSRGIPEKCSFGASSESQSDESPVIGSGHARKKSRSDGPDDTSLEPLERPASLAEQTGYSSLNGSNVLIALQNSLSTSRAAALSEYPVHSSLRGALSDITAQLPPRRVQVDLIDHCFDNALWWFAGVEPYYFRRLHDSWLALLANKPVERKSDEPAKDLLYFPALLYQMMALSLQMLPLDAQHIRLALNLSDFDASEKLSVKYSRLGMQIMDLLGRHNSCITAVQHDIVRANWLKNSSRGSEGWHSLSSAIRQAQEQGLHLQSDVVQDEKLDLSENLRRMWYDEYKRRMWVHLVSWERHVMCASSVTNTDRDSHMSLMLGRPRMICISDCTITTPIDCDIPEDPTRTIPTNVNENKLPSTLSPGLFQYKMGLLIHEMLDQRANQPSLRDYGIVRGLHEKVMMVLDNISPFIRFEDPDTSWDDRRPILRTQRSHMGSSAYSYLMALHRPHVAKHSESREHAISAAITVLRAQQRIFELTKKHLMRIYSYSFYTIDSSIFLSVMLIEHANLVKRELVPEIVDGISQAITRLSVIKEINPMARSGEQILLRCYERIKQLGIHHNLVTRLVSETADDKMPVEPGTVATSGVESTRLVVQSSPVGLSTDQTLDWSTPEFNFDFNLDSFNFDLNTSFQTWMDQMYQMADPNSEPLDDSIWSTLNGYD